MLWGLWRGIEGAASPRWSCLFSRFASLPGVWHWLELEMNVTYGNPWNWPTPGSPSFLQWKFPFSKPISCRGRALERPICQHWQWSRKTFSYPCIATALTQTNTHAHSGQTFCKETSTKPPSVIVNAMLPLAIGLESCQLFAWMSLISLRFCHV